MKVRIVLVFVLLAVVSLSAQTFRGTILGTVTDPSGAVWQLHDIRAVTALVGLFTVLPFWLLAVFRSVARVGE